MSHRVVSSFGDSQDHAYSAIFRSEQVNGFGNPHFEMPIFPIGSPSRGLTNGKLKSHLQDIDIAKLTLNLHEMEGITGK